MQPYLWRCLVLPFAAWVQQDEIEYLKEENRVLREQLGERRIRFTNEQRRRLAAKARALGREGLKEIPHPGDTRHFDAWYRKLIAKKYDGSEHRGPGRPRVSETIRELVLSMARENSTWVHEDLRGSSQSGP